REFSVEELPRRGGELSMPSPWAGTWEDLRALAARSPDTSLHRRGEPYRLAVSGVYARLSATAEKLDVEVVRRPVGKAAPYANVAEVPAHLRPMYRPPTSPHHHL